MAQGKITGGSFYFGDIRKSPDTGVIRFAGNLVNVDRWTDSTLRSNPVSSNYNIKQTSNSGAGKPFSAGTFMYMNARKFIIRRVTDTISGVANTVLRSGAAFPGSHGQHPNVHVRGTILSALSWDASTTDLPAYTATKNQTETTFSDDHAATPTITLAIPGELTFKNSKPLPVNTDYKAHTNG
jgi:hypothetical protein